MSKRRCLTADITFLSEAEGGRPFVPDTTISAKYRPHIVLQPTDVRTAIMDADRVIREDYLAVQFESKLATRSDKRRAIYELSLLNYQTLNYSNITIGSSFTVREGAKIVAFGTVLDSHLGPRNGAAG